MRTPADIGNDIILISPSISLIAILSFETNSNSPLINKLNKLVVFPVFYFQ